MRDRGSRYAARCKPLGAPAIDVSQTPSDADCTVQLRAPHCDRIGVASQHSRLEMASVLRQCGPQAARRYILLSSSPRATPLRRAPTPALFSSATIQRLSAQAVPVQPVQPSLLRRAASLLAIAIVCSSAGFVMSAAPAIKAAQGLITPPSDLETLTMFTPTTKLEQEVEEHINNHPEVLLMRSRPELTESRPHLKMPDAFRSHNLTGGTLLGPGRVIVPPYTWTETEGKSLVSISYVGSDLCGHPGIVHGGFLATMLDEGLARCSFGALPNKIGMTANLNINYRAPAHANNYIVLRAFTTKVEGRKAWVEGRLETLVGPGETPVVIAEASALFIEPRQAATMARVYPTQ